MGVFTEHHLMSLKYIYYSGAIVKWPFLERFKSDISHKSHAKSDKSKSNDVLLCLLVATLTLQITTEVSV